MPDTKRVVVVGASAAGLAVSEELRRRAYAGEIVLVGDEPELPYDRPPLSKQLLAGQWDTDRLLLCPPQHWTDLDVDFVRGVAATGLDTDARTVQLADGRAIAYDEVVIATGAQAIHPPVLGVGVRGVHVLRNLHDALALREDLLVGGRLAIVGAGFIGAEAAAVARDMGVEVTMIDPLQLPMINALGPDIARMLADLHTAHGVEIRCGRGVTEVLTANGRVRGVRLDGGDCSDVVEAATVLVAVGARPAVDWLTGSGVALGDRRADGTDGVLCDGTGHARDGVWAAGDVAAWRDAASGRHVRREHRLSATEQGRAVAAALLGDPSTTAPLPYFWSDQYGMTLQSYGRTGVDYDLRVVDGSLADRTFVAVYLDRSAQPGTVAGVIGAGMPRAMRTWRQAVLTGHPVPELITAPLERTPS